MKAYVDQEGCISCGLCVASCPEVFSFDENGVAEATGGLTDENFASAESARTSCPVSVIDILED
ncbi:MAG: ferredoxin [Eubacteriales bacterium]|nr:ferredoxin [Eubacteriales bacterium]